MFDEPPANSTSPLVSGPVEVYLVRNGILHEIDPNHDPAIASGLSLHAAMDVLGYKPSNQLASEGARFLAYESTQLSVWSLEFRWLIHWQNPAAQIDRRMWVRTFAEFCGMLWFLASNGPTAKPPP